MGIGTGRRPPGGAAAGQRVARVIGGVNAWHLSAKRRGLVMFPRFASVWRSARRGGGGGGGAPRGASPPTCDRLAESQSKTIPLKSRLF